MKFPFIIIPTVILSEKVFILVSLILSWSLHFISNIKRSSTYNMKQWIFHTGIRFPPPKDDPVLMDTTVSILTLFNFFCLHRSTQSLTKKILISCYDITMTGSQKNNHISSSFACTNSLCSSAPSTTDPWTCTTRNSNCRRTNQLVEWCTHQSWTKCESNSSCTKWLNQRDDP